MVRRTLVTTLALSAIFAGAGCGTSERALKLPAVKASLHSADLGNLHVLTQQGAYHELRKKGFPTGVKVLAGPDYLQDPLVPALMVVRFPDLASARRAVPETRIERQGPLSLRVARVCNVVLTNFSPENAVARRREDRVADELRGRCMT
jgi:hypothetical protein